MNTAHGTLQVTDEQIITIFHLVLQVYCSPSLKEQVHNPVMPLLACIRERKESILHAHGGVCARVGVWWLCVVCVCGGCVWCVCTCVCGCVYISVIISASAFRMVDTNLQVYVRVSVITQVQ